jgi:hypothetical protein
LLRPFFLIKVVIRADRQTVRPDHHLSFYATILDMHLNRSRGLCLLIILLIGSAAITIPAWAQAGGNAILSNPRAEAFPRVEFSLDVRDAQGRFVRGLKPDQVHVFENGQPAGDVELSELRPGVQIVIAINPGPPFSTRNFKAVSRYDQITQALARWLKSRQGSTLDDWSVLTNKGESVTHKTNPADLLPAIKQVEARNTPPGLDTLFRAVELAGDPPTRPGMSRAVLFITPPLSPDLNASLDNLTAQAAQHRVRIHVWMVAPIGAVSAKESDRLTALGRDTGGQFLAFDGETALPNPEDLLRPERSIYQVSYTSGITASGQHQITAQIDLPGGGQVVSPPATLNVDLKPPEPVFVSPQLEIRRVPASIANTAAAKDQPVVYIPAEQTLALLVDFPDGQPRPLKRTSLYIDGNLKAENTVAPFDVFTWDLNDYTASGAHLLRIEVEDSLGMVGRSLDTLVQINVELPPPDRMAGFYERLPLISILGIVLAGAILALILILAGRLRPYTLSAYKTFKRRPEPTQASVPAEPTGRATAWVNRMQWPQRHVAPKVHAYLTRLTTGDETGTAAPAAISADETTLGSDPAQASVVIADPVVEPLHARLVRLPDGDFRLMDEGSLAGTWINYRPVGRDGVLLHHGDLIHIGTIGLRFQDRDLARRPQTARTITVHPAAVASPGNGRPAPADKEAAA